MPLDGFENNRGGEGSNGGNRGGWPIRHAEAIGIHLNVPADISEQHANAIFEKTIVHIANILGHPTTDFNGASIGEGKRTNFEQADFGDGKHRRAGQYVFPPEAISYWRAKTRIMPAIEKALKESFEGEFSISAKTKVVRHNVIGSEGNSRRTSCEIKITPK